MLSASPFASIEYIILSSNSQGGRQDEVQQFQIQLGLYKKIDNLRDKIELFKNWSY
jgi:hypothetical protein